MRMTAHDATRIEQDLAPDRGASTESHAVHVGVVEAGGRIHHVVADSSRDGLLRQLAAYVAGWAPYQLWPADGVEIDVLLASERYADAVRLYFERVGERWDVERLSIHCVGRRDDPPPGPA